MKISVKRADALYAAISEPLVRVRLELKLMPAQDYRLAMVEKQIWQALKRVLEGR